MSKELELAALKEIFEEMFEIDPADVHMDSELYDDLDIDSIDAVDLIVKIREITGKKVSPDEFKSVRTVEQVVDAIIKLKTQ